MAASCWLNYFPSVCPEQNTEGSGEETKHSSATQRLLQGRENLLLFNDAGTNKNYFLPLLT